MFQFAYCFFEAVTYALRCGGVNGRVEIGLARLDLRGLVRQGHAELWPVVPFFLPFLGKQKREKGLTDYTSMTIYVF